MHVHVYANVMVVKHPAKNVISYPRGCYYLSCRHCSECVPSAVCPQWQLPPGDVVSALEKDDVNIVIQD